MKQDAPIKVNKISAENSKQTVVTPHMEEKIPKDKNLIYCSTFQLAWNELKDNMIKEDIILQGDSKLPSLLNKSLSTKKDLNSKDYIAMVGYKRDNIIAKINEELKKKFKNAEAVNFPLNSDDDIFAYSYIEKDLAFEKEFESLKNPINFNANGKSVKVSSFGIDSFSNDKHEGLSKQVDILYDGNTKDDFILRLNSKSPDDEIILAKITPEETLLKTIEKSEKLSNSKNPSKLQEEDKLAVPKLSFDINKNYSELVGKPIANDKFKDYSIIAAYQKILFKLDEKGAYLKSSAGIGVSKGIHMNKNYIFNKDFLIYLKQKDANYPYLALWVNNEELMDIKPEVSN